MNSKYKQDFIHAGKLAKETRAYGKSLIVKGASYNDVIEKILKKIKELKAEPAFPPQIALNEVAAHFLPEPGVDIIFSDELVKLDVGICYQGAIGDCAVTIDLSGKHQNIIDAAESALHAAEKCVEVGRPVREIGKAIEETISSYGLRPIINLAGHGLGFYKVHTAPNIPNYYDQSTAVIKPGMTFAIEPFATNGKGLIYEEGAPAIFSLANPKYSGFGQDLLIKIRSFQGLPFSIHELVKDGPSILEVRMQLKELLEKGVIMGYGPLIEEAGGMVAQAENSILVDEKGKVFVTTR